MSEINKYRLPVMPESGVMWIDYIALSALEFWPRNPKIHDEDGLAGSINRWGVVTAVLLDESTQLLVAGEGRLKEIRRLKAKGAPVPKRVVEYEGEWFMPVIRGVSFESQQEAEAYLFADNQLTMAGGWDEAGAAEMLRDWVDTSPEALRGTGFDEKDVEDFFSFLDEEASQEKKPREPKEQGALMFKLLQAVGHHQVIEKTIEMFQNKYGLDRPDAFKRVCEVAADNMPEDEEPESEDPRDDLRGW